MAAASNAANQNLIMTILQMLHYQVECVSNGKEAIEVWTRAEYDMILMDSWLPCSSTPENQQHPENLL